MLENYIINRIDPKETINSLLEFPRFVEIETSFVSIEQGKFFKELFVLKL